MVFRFERYSNLKRLKINCNQVHIEEIRVENNAWIDFDLEDPLENLSDYDWKRLDNADEIDETFKIHLKESDPWCDGGELIIDLSECDSGNVSLNEDGSFDLIISMKFSLENPRSGVHFRTPLLKDGNIDWSLAHMFATPYYNSARSCFPCIDAPDKLCLWDLEFCVPKHMSAVSSGDLLKCIQFNNGKRLYRFSLRVPTAAQNIAFAVGNFIAHVDRHQPQITSFCTPEFVDIMQDAVDETWKMLAFFEGYFKSSILHDSYKQVRYPQT
ncbi:unnamed protein product [Notodromas monacha]|uniref:Aminopeptidase N-like N-terminal domain-containing protein n=1 Tax=Notodromas monacha TaxID=399045 RepID=A0A7R9BYP0_9CRUS|nr:unnamed protein product [Notodromas monacha]CAG0924123.1 unnamed protein product [Notodromas monacha]